MCTCKHTYACTCVHTSDFVYPQILKMVLIPVFPSMNPKTRQVRGVGKSSKQSRNEEQPQDPGLWGGNPTELFSKYIDLLDEIRF